MTKEQFNIMMEKIGNLLCGTSVSISDTGTVLYNRADSQLTNKIFENKLHRVVGVYDDLVER